MSNDVQIRLKESSDKIRNRYDLLFEKAKSDAGSSGDNGEELWAEILREWLPQIFEVRVKAKIISREGKESPQIDIVVLSPFYPKALRGDTYILASGVVAAFECKNTLQSGHFKKFFENSRAIASLCDIEAGKPKGELCSPIVYGLLAHSHEWKEPKSTPAKNIERALKKNLENTEFVSPRQLPDLLCVADVGTWSKSTQTFNLLQLGRLPRGGEEWPKFIFSISSNYTSFRKSDESQNKYDPLNVFLKHFYSHFYEDYPQLVRISRDLIYQSTGTSGVSYTHEYARRFQDDCISEVSRNLLKKFVAEGTLSTLSMFENCLFPPGI